MAKAKTRARRAKAEGEENQFPHEAKYADGSIFNMPVDYWSQFTEDQVRQKLVDAKNEEEVVDGHIALIGEALTYHGLEFGSNAPQPEPEAEE